MIGIDFGTIGSRAAVLLDGQVLLFPLDGKQTALPSVVTFDSKGRVLVGNRAKASALLDPRHTVFAMKRLICLPAKSARAERLKAYLPFETAADEQGMVAAEVRGRKVSMVEATSHVLAEIRERSSEYLGKRVERAVITVPTAFTHAHREALVQAAARAGLAVQRIVNDTTAAALAYGRGRGLPRRRVLVCDFGGGAFSASVIQMTGDELEVVASGGDNQLGGLDLDFLIASELRRLFLESSGVTLDDKLALQRVREAAEAAKILLSEQADAVARVPSAATKDGQPLNLEVPIGRARLEAIGSGLVDRALGICRAALSAPALADSSIDEILIVGGQGRSPLARGQIEKALGRPVRSDFDATVAVATGAAMVASGIDEGESGAVPLRMADVLGSWIGVAARDGRFITVLDQNTPVPCQKSCIVPACAGPAKLVVLQGGQRDVQQAEILGATNVPGEPGVESSVVFAVSADGRVTVSSRRPDGELVPLALAPVAEAPEALFSASPFAGAEEGGGVFAGLKRLFRGSGGNTRTGASG